MLRIKKGKVTPANLSTIFKC